MIHSIGTDASIHRLLLPRPKHERTPSALHTARKNNHLLLQMERLLDSCVRIYKSDSCPGSAPEGSQRSSGGRRSNNARQNGSASSTESKQNLQKQKQKQTNKSNAAGKHPNVRVPGKKSCVVALLATIPSARVTPDNNSSFRLTPDAFLLTNRRNLRTGSSTRRRGGRCCSPSSPPPCCSTPPAPLAGWIASSQRTA